MNDYLNELKDFPLFEGIWHEDLGSMLDCMGGNIKWFKKGEFVSLEKDSIISVGIVLNGCIHMIKEDFKGDKTLLAIMGKGDLFGETFVCSRHLESTVAFYVAEKSEILFLPFHKLIISCNKSCLFHHQLIQNMMMLVAKKNVSLLEKVEILSKKTIRDKILTFLSQQKLLNNSNYFEITLGRLELAEYLGVDRSALTRELNHMRNERLIDFDKKTFHLL